MKSISCAATSLNSNLVASWIDGLARITLIKIFKQLAHGHLTLEDRGEVLVFGEPQARAAITAHISVTHSSFYRRVLFGGTLGAGEAYMEKTWTSPDLVMVVRLMAINLAVLQTMDTTGWHGVKRLLGQILHSRNQNSTAGAKRNIAAHYDLSNQFFSLFLDPSMMYSAAIYPHAQASLVEASQFKLQQVCCQLQLRPEDHLLEIGTGWGGLAIYAAQHFGCRVTSITISQAQYDYAVQQVMDLQLSHLVCIRLCDYREMEGSFDKLVSIEMIEAVGYQFYGNYFAQCGRLLKANGLMLIQAITIPHRRFARGRDKMDFIRGYIFPGGCLPSTLEICRHVAEFSDLELVNFSDITAHYAHTLRDWRTQFFANIEAVKALGFNDVFIRMWDYYLCYCEGGFAERIIGTAQMTFAKPQYQVLLEDKS